MRTMSREEAIDFVSGLSREEQEKVLEFIKALRAEPEARTETESRKEALISLLRAYRGELAQAEYTAEVKDPLRMDIMDSLWKAENLLTGEEALRKHQAEE